VHKKLGGDTAGTAGPPRPQGYPMPYDITLSTLSRGKKEGEDIQNDGVCLPKSPSHVTQPCCPGDG